MDYAESLAEHNRMVLDAARLSGGSRAHDASAHDTTHDVCDVCGVAHWAYNVVRRRNGDLWCTVANKTQNGAPVNG